MGEPPVRNGAAGRSVECRVCDQAARNRHQRGDSQAEYRHHVRGMSDRDVWDREANPQTVGPGHEKHFGQTDARQGYSHGQGVTRAHGIDDRRADEDRNTRGHAAQIAEADQARRGDGARRPNKRNTPAGARQHDGAERR